MTWRQGEDREERSIRRALDARALLPRLKLPPAQTSETIGLVELQRWPVVGVPLTFRLRLYLRPRPQCRMEQPSDWASREEQTDVDSFAPLEPTADGFRNYLRGKGARPR